MPRPERRLDPNGGPLVEFAQKLRELRATAGQPLYATMARRCGRSKTALTDAAAGRRLPRWETVEGFVRACDPQADMEPWRAQWEAVKAALTASPDTPPDDGTTAEGESGAPELPNAVTGNRDETTPAPVAPARADNTQPPGPTPDPTTSRTRRWTRARERFGLSLALAAAIGLLAGAGAIMAVWVVVAHTAGAAGSSESTGGSGDGLRVIVLQNKVAIGANGLVEDKTPAYLSTMPVRNCADPDRACKVPGTEMGSGAAIVASCTVHGQRMVNYNAADPATTTNPDRADSDLWYRASFPDGRSGLISAVYLIAHDSGGLGLPPCSPPT